MFYICTECGSVFKDKEPEECDGCREKNFYEKEELEMDDIINLISAYQRRTNTSYSDSADYWEVHGYIKDYIGEDIYGDLLDNALKEAENRHIAVYREIVYFMDW